MPQTEPLAVPAVVDITELPNRVGDVLGHSRWHDITQEEVDAFARLTGDEQWIHVDPDRAKTGPFRRTIAHGYFTLSLSTIFLDQVVTVTGAPVVLNYGANRVRFPAPVPVGARVRANVELAAVEPVTGGVQAHWHLAFEVEGSPKPGCIAEILYRYYSHLPSRG